MLDRISIPTLIVLAVAALITPSIASAQTTWYVDDNAPNDPSPGDPTRSDPLEDGSAEHPFDAIQEGIDAATDGDVVLVESGLYAGTGNRGLSYSGKAITVRSADGPLTCIIDCEQDGRGFHFGQGETAAAVVAGFTITNGDTDDGGAIQCLYGSSPTIRSCVLIGNQAERGGAVYARQGDPTLIGCAILDNAALDTGGGVLCREGTITIVNCTVANNSAATGGGGAQIAAGGEMTVVNTILTGNEAPAGPDLRVLGASQPSTLTVTYSDIPGGQSLIDVAENCTLVWGDGNITDDPTLTGNDTHLLAGSPCIDAGDPNAGYLDQTDIDAEPRDGDERADIGADEFFDADADGLPDWWEELYFGSPTAGDAQGDENADGVVNLDEYAQSTSPLVDGVTYYVDVSGDSRWDGRSPVWDGQHGPKQTIQAGIDLAVDANGETVIIADGVYAGDGSKDLDFRGAAITVRSENGYESCIVDCELEGRGVYFHSSETPASVLEGITITNAYDPDGYAEAILCEASNPTIRNCSIVDNQNGGIHCYDSTVMIEGCNIACNYYAGVYCEDGAVTIVESTITENHQGGVFLSYNSGAISLCTISENRGYGGIHAESPASLRIADCVIHANEVRYGYGGGGVYCCCSSDFVITRCTISNNSADYGGGIQCCWVGTQAGLIHQCTIVENAAVWGGGGVRVSEGGSLLITDCHIARNTALYGSAGLSVLGPVDVSVVGARIEENAGAWAGGVFAAADHFEAVDCEIRGNVAEESGGGLYTYDYYPVECHVELTNCLLADNVALEGDGGGFGCGDQVNPPTLRNCTIVGNSAGNSGGGMHCVTEIDVTNSVFCGNQADLGSQLAIEELDDPAGETLTFSDIAGGPSGIHVATGTLGWHESNIDADPLFVDPDGPDDDPNTWEDNNYRLSPSSPCIDAADNTAVPLDTLDLDGDGDTDEPTPFDLDARLRFADRIAAADTGNPDPNFPDLSIVDMGAYEYQCTADLDGNGQINLADLAQLLGSYGETADITYQDGDLDADGDVDLADLAELLGVYGTICE